LFIFIAILEIFLHTKILILRIILSRTSKKHLSITDLTHENIKRFISILAN